jgi:pimeloyl-ACP methyl ester carboxylesterase
MQDIFSEDIGSSAPLVLVHGFLESSDMWGPQIKFFKDNFRVIVPALSGFGNSSAMNSCNSIECIAQTILNLSEKKIKNLNLLRHSMGRIIVQEITKIAGEKILKLICYSKGPRGGIPGRFETIDESREKLKVNGLKDTTHRIAKTWFIEEEKAKYFYLCEEVGKQTSIEAADNGLDAM